MKVTKERIKELSPCKEGWEWYLKNQEEDLLTLLLDANKHNPSDARWLFTRLMDKTQCMRIAAFSAREVLHIFEEKYPEDKRPRKSIEAVETYLKDPSERNRELAAAAAAAYAYTDAAAYAAAASADASASASASAASASAAYAYASAAASAASAATYAYAADAYAAYTAAVASDADYTAAYTASSASSAASYAAYAAAKKELQEKIIKEAVRILETL